ncbi:hypothetical protein DM860_001870 [Cuscuta australis]|uniref:Ubiquitin carboxyl-terminal hydrolase n=1 Tax=Cuscuta australis TaxID=267555 RepID=A0A328EA65_9ASTE|nr:hypothetical protein DM860_001870 [Cuscuta australis]
MGTETSETAETNSSLNSPDYRKNGTGVRGRISAQVRSSTENSPGNGNGEGDAEGAGDDLTRNSLTPVRSFSHWSQQWSTETAEPKLYGGVDSNGGEPDWTDTWMHGDHHSSPSISGSSGLDLKCKADPVSLGWSEWHPDETGQEIEHSSLEDNTSFNFCFLDDEASSPVGGGLANLGNTCFLNAVLQGLMHIVPLLQSIEAYSHPSPCDAFNEVYCVLCDLKELTNATLSSKGSIVNPWKTVNNFSYFSSSFQRYQQEDSHEFLLCFLDGLERSCSYVKPEGQVYSNHVNFVKQTFGGHLISKLQCFNCGHCSITYEPLVDLSLEIGDADSLHMALDSFTKTEKIEDTAAKFTCEKCKLHVSLEKQLLLDETPLVAIFHLKRFKNDGSLVEKIDKHISFPLELDLLPYVKRDKKHAESKYNLVAVLVHIGLTLHSGHYYCFIHSSPNEWYKFDDSKVTRVQEDFVMSQSAYILFYARQDTPWFSDFIQTKHLKPNSSPKQVLYNVDSISGSSPIREIGSRHKVICTSEKGKENLCNSSDDICSANAEKTPTRSVLKENNTKQDFRASKRRGDVTSKTRSGCPEQEIYEEDTTDEICCKKDESHKRAEADLEGSMKKRMRRREAVCPVGDSGELSLRRSLRLRPLKASSLR